jgi:N-hydroxyarylamine O-acetyltransferase
LAPPDTRLLQRHLKLLRLEEQKPDLPFLKALVQAQLHHVPYENISKLIRFGDHGLTTLPSYEVYLNGLEEFQYGGTCYAQNGYFAELLRGLGFASSIHAAGSTKTPQSHLAILVALDQQKWVIDLGMFATFVGPFKLTSEARYSEQIGKTGYLFEGLEETRYRISTLRENTPPRIRQAQISPLALEAFVPDIAASFQIETTMMKSIGIFRLQAGTVSQAWNRVMSIDQERFEFNSIQELESAVHWKMNLPRFNMRRAYEVLNSHCGITLFN